ncbi:MAG TPA: ABC transporter ATP-binding protein [Acidobacteriaceae bacterium]|nr:ABC transporter ATP-binding protein [Acidobacteriaceae bacterium]
MSNESANHDPIIELNNATREYRGRAGNVRALDAITLSVRRGEWVAITGPSGSGKSTLVNLLGCLDHADAGTVRIAGKDVHQLSRKELDQFRAETVGFIFQQFHLIPYLTALENIMLAQYFHSMTDWKEAMRALQIVGLAQRAGHLPSELSGGEQQRVCIARALINHPPVLLADEPTGNLDAANQEIVTGLLRSLHRQGHTILMVTHDPEMARLADRIIELHHGRIMDEGRIKDEKPVVAPAIR